jgi:hypothetical protein
LKYKILSLLIIVAMVSLCACQKKQESEKKETPKKVSGGFVINFKPNDSLDLVPPKTIILQPARAEGENNFCVDVVAKSLDQVSTVSFDLTFDSASMSYQSFGPGILFEQKGKAGYKVGPKGDQKGKLEAKVTFESGGPASGTGKLVTLCFKGLQPVRGDMLFENGELIDAHKKKVAGGNWIGGLLWILETS